MNLRFQTVDGNDYFMEVDTDKNFEELMKRFVNDDMEWIFVKGNRAIRVQHIVEIEVVE